jgi:hypothetical protein
MRSKLSRCAAAVFLVVAINAGPGWSQKQKVAAAPEMPGKASASRIGPIYGPDSDKNAKEVTVNVVTDFIPPRDAPVVLDLDEIKNSASLACTDCESGKEVHPTEARRFSDLDEGITLVIAIEVGQGMAGQRLASVKQGLLGIFSRKHAKDRVALVTIGNDLHTIADFSKSDEALKQAVNDQLRAEPTAFPRLYRGITKAFDLFDQADQTFPARRRMLVVSTGRNEATAEQAAAGGFRDDDIIARADQVHAVVDAIGVPVPLPTTPITLIPPTEGVADKGLVLQLPPTQSVDAYLDALEKIARATGGIFLRQDPKHADIGVRMSQGVQWLRDTPVLVFNLKEAAPSDGREHKVALRLTSQPGRDFSGSVFMPLATPLWRRFLPLIIFVAAILLFLAFALFKGKPKPVELSPAAAAASSQPLKTPDAAPAQADRPGFGDRTLREGFAGRMNMPESGVGAGGASGFQQRPAQQPQGRSSTRVLSSVFPEPSGSNPCCSLRVVNGAWAGTAFPMNFPEVSIGREQSMNTFALPDPGISSHHATLRWNSGMLTITDDGSTNGTSVGNIRLTAAKPHPLQPGDRIQLGSSTLVVELPGRA